MVLLMDFNFSPSPLFNQSGLNELHELGSLVFARRYAGREGVLRIAFAFSEDGRVVHADEREVPGTVNHIPSGGAGTKLDQIWVPTGYRQTISNLIEYQPRLNRRERAYRIVGTLLGTSVAEEIYEAHVTVALRKGQTVQTFREICTAIGVKAIHIELPAGKVPTHFITGSIHAGELAVVVRQVEHLVERIEEAGLVATRTKIEAMVQNKCVPLSDEDAVRRQNSNYFEFHTKVTLSEAESLDPLSRICEFFGAHLARSASNKFGNGSTQRFVTLRFHSAGRTTAEKTFSRLIQALRDADYHPTHFLKEYVVVDTNLELDAGWADSVIPSACYSDCQQLAHNQCPFQEGANLLVRMDESKGNYGPGKTERKSTN